MVASRNFVRSVPACILSPPAPTTLERPAAGKSRKAEALARRVAVGVRSADRQLFPDSILHVAPRAVEIFVGNLRPARLRFGKVTTKRRRADPAAVPLSRPPAARLRPPGTVAEAPPCRSSGGGSGYGLLFGFGTGAFDFRHPNVA